MRDKEWREARKAQGLCIRCDNPVKHYGTGSECASHLKRSGERQKKYISKDRTALKRAQKKYLSKDRRALKRAQKKYKAKNKDAINAQTRKRYHIKKEEKEALSV